MTDTDVVITNSANSRQFLFRGVSRFAPKKGQPVNAIPLINTSAGSNALFRFTGQTEEITFSFALFDDGTDVSSATFATQIITVAQQEQYLKNSIFTEEFDTTWTLYDTQGIVYPQASAISGVITNLEFENKQGAQTVVLGSLTFKRGRIANL